MTHSKRLASIWNNIKKVAGFKKKVSSYVQLNDATVLPLFVALFKNVYTAYIQTNHNSWDYQISRYPHNRLDKHEAKSQLIKQYNNYLYFLDTENPWIIDERDQNFIKIIRKRYLENEEKLLEYSRQLIDSEVSKKLLTRKKIKKRQQYLSEIATLACFELDHDLKNKKLIFSYLSYEEALLKFKNLLKEDSSTIKLKIKRIQKRIANNTKDILYYSEFYGTNPNNIYTRWEKIEYSLNKNILFKFFNTIWKVISGHANLLKWISFILILFSLPFPSFPLILFIIISILSYLVLLFILFIKSNKVSTFSDLLEPLKKEKLISQVKHAVHIKLQYKKQFALLQNQLFYFDIDIEELYKNLYSQIQKNTTNCIQATNLKMYLDTRSENDEKLKNQLENSSLYQYLNQVYPKTLFIVSLVTNLMSVTLYAYLISWASSIFFGVIGAVTLASLISSPLAVGLFIFIPVCIFLVRYSIQYQSRKKIYQRNIINLLKESCEFSFVDNEGKLQQITLEKWKKFEYLNKEIQLLEIEIHRFTQNISSSQEIQKIFLLLNDYLYNFNIYKTNHETKKSHIKIFIYVKKGLNRLFSFSSGGLCGFNLVKQVLLESSLNLNKISGIISVSLSIIFFVPVILMNGIANLLTYHLNSRQRNLLFFAEHLDSKLQLLEYRRKILLYLFATLKTLDVPIINQGASEKASNLFIKNQLAYLDLTVKKIHLKEDQLITKFFILPTRSLTQSLLKKPTSDASIVKEADSYPNLTR